MKSYVVNVEGKNINIPFLIENAIYNTLKYTSEHNQESALYGCTCSVTKIIEEDGYEFYE